MGVALVIVVMIEARKNNIQSSQKRASGKERWEHSRTRSGDC